MPGTLVCGIDDGEDAGKVAMVATRLADHLRLELMAVHVRGVQTAFPYGDQAVLELRRRGSLEQGERLLSGLSASGVLPEGAITRVELGDPARWLEQIGQEDDVSLLVVGSRGRGRLRAAVLGSVSRELATRPRRPVMVVPGHASQGVAAEEPKPSGDIVCGVDGSERSGFAAEHAAALAQRLGVGLVLVHALSSHVPVPGASHSDDPGAVRSVHASGEELLTRDASRLWGTYDVEVSTRLRRGPAASVLEEVASEQDAPFVVVGAHDPEAITAALLGSPSTDLAPAASRPVVIAPPAAPTLDRLVDHGLTVA
jgi:nucleotide-binding universal stress UspA family protein